MSLYKLLESVDRMTDDEVSKYLKEVSPGYSWLKYCTKYKGKHTSHAVIRFDKPVFDGKRIFNVYPCWVTFGHRSNEKHSLHWCITEKMQLWFKDTKTSYYSAYIMLEQSMLQDLQEGGARCYYEELYMICDVPTVGGTLAEWNKANYEVFRSMCLKRHTFEEMKRSYLKMAVLVSWLDYYIFRSDDADKLEADLKTMREANEMYHVPERYKCVEWFNLIGHMMCSNLERLENDVQSNDADVLEE